MGNCFYMNGNGQEEEIQMDRFPCHSRSEQVSGDYLALSCARRTIIIV